jgi:adenine-specific DNA-methyltransferase
MSVIEMVNKTPYSIKNLKGNISEEETRLYFQRLIEIIANKIGTELPYTSNIDTKKVKVDEKIEESLLIPFTQKIIENSDVIDDVYSILVAKQYRKKYGQFFTPPNIAKFMAKWVISKKGEKVLDPGVGSGIFLSQVFQLLKNERAFHLTGIDIDPVLLNACFIRLKLLGMNTGNLRLIKSDFLTWEDEDKYDSIICNPPYIKFHGFDRSIIKKISQEFGIQLTQLTNIYALFFIRAAKFINPGGRIAFITPSEFLYTGYGQELKKFLLKNFKIEAFILVGLEKEVFENVMSTGLITLLIKEKPEKGHKVKFINIESTYQGNLKDLEDLESIVEIPQHQLNPEEKWLIYFIKDENIREFINELVPLSTIATVDRGIATGCNEFYTLAEETIKKFSIPEQFLKPVISKASHAIYYDFTFEDWVALRKKNEKVFLLYCFTEQPPKQLEKYLEYGLKIGVHKRYLPSHRKIWYSVEKRDPAPILALVFSRERMRFIFNKAKVLNLTPFHCVYPIFNDELKLKALLAYLSSNICKEIATYWGRIYGTGLRKLEPKDLENLPVIDVTGLTQEDIEKLANLFDRLCIVSREDFNKEIEIKKMIDEAVKDILKNLKNKLSKRQKFLYEFIT